MILMDITRVIRENYYGKFFERKDCYLLGTADEESIRSTRVWRTTHFLVLVLSAIILGRKR